MGIALLTRYRGQRKILKKGKETIGFVMKLCKEKVTSIVTYIEKK